MNQLQLIEISGSVIFGGIALNGNIEMHESLSLEGNIILGGGGSEYPIYTDEYIVTPYADRQTVLDTDGKVLVDDVTVLEIPYTETSNQYGTTIAIATE